MAEQDERPVTLASLLGGARRSRPGGARSAAPPTLKAPLIAAQSQLGLLFATPAPTVEAKPEKSLPTATPGPREMLRAPAPALSPLQSIQPRPAPASTPPAALERRIWTVRSLVSDVRQQVEGGYADLWVEGELSNCRPAPSGHIYATLKDGEAQLPIVLFRRQAALLRFRPVDGLAVLVRGRVSIYEGRGQLQLIAETMEPRGAGALQIAFEQLKARLLAEGLFAQERKRPLPAYPRCLGIITSTGGAVLRDIITVCRRRHARLNLLVYPALMQGPHCASSVAAGLRWFAQNSPLVDLIVIARGGGSLEDLSGFNDEALARAIAACSLPVVSAVGHETDFTIADFVADLRAPTPSAAAEIITGAQHRIEERLDALHRSVLRAGRYHLLHARTRFDRLSAAAVLRRLRDAIGRREQRIDDLRQRQEIATERHLRLHRQRLLTLTERLLRQDATHRLTLGRHRLQSAGACLDRAARNLTASRRPRLDHLRGRLEALSPVAVLARGYALVYASDGTLLRDASAATIGQTIQARLASGSLRATVAEIQKT